MLQLESNGTLILDGTKVSLAMDDMKEFIMASLSEPCRTNGIRMGELMNVFFHVQDFIRIYLIEEYHAINALVTTMESTSKIKRVVFSKRMVVDGDDRMTLVPIVRVEIGDEGPTLLREAVVELDDKLEVPDDLLQSGRELRSDFTLLEVMDCVFSELSHTLTNSPEDSDQIWSL